MRSRAISQLQIDASMKWLALLAAMFVGLMVAYSIFYPTTTYKFRITLNVDTPRGLKSGSSVMEVRDTRYPSWMVLGANSGGSRLRGEAVFVDLGLDAASKSQNLLGLLLVGPRGRDPDVISLLEVAFKSSLKTAQPAEIARLPAGTKATLTVDNSLSLMNFGNIDDPKSAKAIQWNDFTKDFGGGYSLRSTTIEMVSTNEAVTAALSKRLPWWTASGRPAEIALRSAGYWTSSPERAFIRD